MAGKGKEKRHGTLIICARPLHHADEFTLCPGDLRPCFAEWETQGWIDEFAPGKRGTADRLLIEGLLSAFDGVVGDRGLGYRFLDGQGWANSDNNHP